jgi:hypothetical protein
MILYNDNGLKIIISIMNIDENIIADKDVPSGLYYKIIQNFDIPIEPIETWEIEINQSNADGIGLSKEEFDYKYPEYKGWAVQ